MECNHIPLGATEKKSWINHGETQKEMWLCHFTPSQEDVTSLYECLQFI